MQEDKDRSIGLFGSVAYPGGFVITAGSIVSSGLVIARSAFCDEATQKKCKKSLGCFVAKAAPRNDDSAGNDELAITEPVKRRPRHEVVAIKEQGFTLLELLIAVFLSSFLLTILFNIYLSSARIYTLQRATTRLQSNVNRLSYLFKQFPYDKFNIKKTTRKYKDGTPIYSLYLQDQHQEKEIVEGVNDSKVVLDVLIKNHIVTKRREEITSSDHVVGALIELQLTAPPLTKKWYTYETIS